MRERPLCQSNPYWLPDEEYRTALHYAAQYQEWEKELRTPPDTSKAVTYDGEKVQTSGGYDATSEMAIRRYLIIRKKQKVETTITEVAPEIYTYLLLGVGYRLTYKQLENRGIPCGKSYYYKKRQRFYYELSKKI